MSMWNHFDNHEERTNNRVEGDNNKMKLFCGGSDPKMDKAVGLLQQYEVTACDKYNNAKKENSKALPQRADVAIREANFRQARKFFRDGKLSTVLQYKTFLNLSRKRNMLKNWRIQMILIPLQYLMIRMTRIEFPLRSPLRFFKF